MDGLKLVMNDRDLNIKSKAIYAYLNRLSGASKMCYPSCGKMAYDLNIGVGTLRKYVKELAYLGYITVQKSRVNNRFSNNIYILNKKNKPEKCIKRIQNWRTRVLEDRR